MIKLFSQEKVNEIHDYNIAKDAFAEGMAKGRYEERLRSLKSLMKKLGLSAEQAMDVLEIAEEERPGYLEKLSSP